MLTLSILFHLDEVNRLFDPGHVLTERGYAFVQTWSIKAAHPVLPFFLNILATMASLTNGAAAKLFPSNGNPLFAFFLNVNYAQTRKSAGTSIVDAMGEHLDAAIRQRVMAAFAEGMEAEAARQQDPDLRPRSPQPQITSAVLHGSTPEAFFQRCSGDFQQVANSSKIGLDALQGRCHYGVLVNLDEAYDMLQAFGFISEDGKASGGKQSMRVSPHQSALNKLAQFGLASRTTKTGGSFGEGRPPIVSTSIIGNFHPSMYVPMERGHTGSHHACGKERIIIGTAEPIQPHADLPADYKLPAGCCRWRWVPLVRDVAIALDLEEGAEGPDAAERVWARARAPGSSADPAPDELVHGETDNQFSPDAAGFIVTLPDGTASCVRFRRKVDAPSGFVPEWRISNRSFPPPETHSIKDAVDRVNDYYLQAHRDIPFSVEALKLHQSYQGAFNVACFSHRAGGDVQAGARFGAAPWMLGILAALLLVFDIFTGTYDGTEAYTNRSLEVTEQHVDRAHSLLKVVLRIKEMVVRGEDRARDAATAGASAAERSKREAHERAARAHRAAEPTQTLWDASAFYSFSQASPQGAAEGAATQQLESQARLAAPAPSFPAADTQEGEDARGDVTRPVGEDVAEEAAVVSAQPLSVEQVRAMDYGYGEGGASVQGQLHAPHLTDRFIMRSTLLTGTPRIFGRSVCDKLRSSAAQRRKALPKAQWERVVSAGLQGATVARMVDAGQQNAAVVLRQVPTDAAEKINYHNEVMRLCQLSLRELTEAMKAGALKARAPASHTASARSRSRSRQRVPPRRRAGTGSRLAGGGDGSYGAGASLSAGDGMGDATTLPVAADGGADAPGDGPDAESSQPVRDAGASSAVEG